LQNNTLYSR